MDGRTLLRHVAVFINVALAFVIMFKLKHLAGSAADRPMAWSRQIKGQDSMGMTVSINNCCKLSQFCQR